MERIGCLSPDDNVPKLKLFLLLLLLFLLMCQTRGAADPEKVF